MFNVQTWVGKFSFFRISPGFWRTGPSLVSYRYRLGNASTGACFHTPSGVSTMIAIVTRPSRNRYRVRPEPKFPGIRCIFQNAIMSDRDRAAGLDELFTMDHAAFFAMYRDIRETGYPPCAGQEDPTHTTFSITSCRP